MITLQPDYFVLHKTLQAHCTHLLDLIRNEALCQNLLLFINLYYILLHLDQNGSHYSIASLTLPYCCSISSFILVTNTICVHQEHKKRNGLQSDCVLIIHCYTTYLFFFCCYILFKTLRFLSAILCFFCYATDLFLRLIRKVYSRYLQTCETRAALIFCIPNIFSQIDQILVKSGNNNRETNECNERKSLNRNHSNTSCYIIRMNRHFINDCLKHLQLSKPQKSSIANLFLHSYLYIFIMQKNFYNSRSVIIDAIFKKSLESSYNIHKKKLEQIKLRKTDAEVNQYHDQILRRKLSHKVSVGRVTEQFHPCHNQKRSLVKHITQIATRKQDAISEYKRYKNKYQQNEKEEIKRQNKILLEKIAESKSNKLTKKDLKKQFKEYESQKNLLRKIHYQCKKPKKKRQQSYDVTDHEHH